MVSYIQSNYAGFGSGLVEPTFGISLQNRRWGFRTTPNGTNRANLVAPGKRPFHIIIPAGDPGREGYVSASDPRRDGLAAGF